MNTTTQPMDVMFMQERYDQMLREDTFQALNAPPHRLMARILSEDPCWLPRMPQAPAHIQLFVLNDNHTLLFSDVQWKFDLEACMPGITAFKRHYDRDGYMERRSTPQLDADGRELTWVPAGSCVSGQSWSDWLLVQELSSFIRVTNYPKARLAVLASLDWLMAKVWIQSIFDGDDQADLFTYSLAGLVDAS